MWNISLFSMSSMFLHTCNQEGFSYHMRFKFYFINVLININILGKMSSIFLKSLFQAVLLCAIFQFEKPGARDIDYPTWLKKQVQLMNLVQMFSTLYHRNMNVFDWFLWHRAESAGGCWGQVQCHPTSLCRLCVWYAILIVSIQYNMTCQQVLCFMACSFLMSVYVLLYFSRWLNMWSEGYLSRSGFIRDPYNQRQQ